MPRSIRIHEFGGPDVLRIEDVMIVNPAAGEVRLRIHAIGLNRTELTLRAGRSPVKPALPSGIGFEAAGVIDALGPGVLGFAVGDRVAIVPAYGAAQYPLYGEMSIAPARSLSRFPTNSISSRRPPSGPRLARRGVAWSRSAACRKGR